MKIQHGVGKTEHGPGVSIELTGDEVAVAIDLYLCGQGVRIKGPRTVMVNGELCETGQIYVDPLGSVTQGNKRYIGNGETLKRFDYRDQIWWIPEIPHNGFVEYNGLLFGRFDVRGIIRKYEAS